ncbi:biliverdin-producing heme oxygenase [Sphingomonas sp. 1P06PA]|uniref:biliverdin-producing heme oxygenase n=1 Tax=Sphingomonas sp. 1P06PA TaxID=554121 RepID=UPI0039A7428F
MKDQQSTRSYLRAATQAWHDRVDHAFSRFSLMDADSYRLFLQAQAHAFLPLEAAIGRTQPGDALPDWDQRQRSDLLIADLAALDAAPGPVSDAPLLDGEPELLGTAYVLEGSRLGGTMLARSVPAHLPRQFLDANDSALWRSLIRRLDTRLTTDDERSVAASAAQRAFRAFEQGANHFSELQCRG